MISLIRNSDGTIKTFSESLDSKEVLVPGESLEYVNTSFAEYASRLILSYAGKSGETIRVPQSSGNLTVEIHCPGESSLSIDINGSVEPLLLIEGQAALLLGTEEAETFILKPADTRKYSPAGQSILVIEVV